MKWFQSGQVRESKQGLCIHGSQYFEGPVIIPELKQMKQLQKVVCRHI